MFWKIGILGWISESGVIWTEQTTGIHAYNKQLDAPSQPFSFGEGL